MGQFGAEDGQIDTLVLGCTHYPFASEHLSRLLGPEVRLIDNGEPVARQTRRLLKTLSPNDAPGHCVLLATGDGSHLQHAARHWLALDFPTKTLQI